MLSDLEADYINPIDLCNKLNSVRSPILTPQYYPSRLVVKTVCPPGTRCTRFPHSSFPPFLPMDSITGQSATFSLQCE